MSHFSNSDRDSKRRSSARLIIVLVAAVSAFAPVIVAPPAGAIGSTAEERYRPSEWAPTNFVSLLDNNASWGNVAYYMKWLLPNNLASAIYDDGAHTTLEIGWKSTGRNNCLFHSGTFNRAGFPPDMNIQTDPTEDTDDAVVWFANLDELRDDWTLAPNKQYSVWYKCQDAYHLEQPNPYDIDTFEGDTSLPYLELQTGHWNSTASPYTSYSDATLHYVPAEHGNMGVPSTGSNLYVQTTAGVPWLANSNFEDATLAPWYTNTTVTRSTLGADTGNAYAQLRPTTAPGSSTWIRQDFAVATVTNREGPLWFSHTTGSNTNFQFDGSFRCPIYSYSGTTGLSSGGSDHCSVSVAVKTVQEPYWTPNPTLTFSIPADGQWHYKLWDSMPAQVSDDDVSVVVNSNGVALDVDMVWVSGGI